ncbi:hypothetical protein E2C01_011182 [Portunus trituberculatus]|uniref:Uncharacterized protein n=1 Tax=Portunus trituberculatus TaxID=210409 RepID=A0A5B7DAK2_PORTR|nr:hypothetical protein [Portunus trituberculatus]
MVVLYPTCRPCHTCRPYYSWPFHIRCGRFYSWPFSMSSFFKPMKCADPATVGPSTYASDSADDDILSPSAHSAEYE